jgi:hypothetical protein
VERGVEPVAELTEAESAMAIRLDPEDDHEAPLCLEHAGRWWLLRIDDLNILTGAFEHE